MEYSWTISARHNVLSWLKPSPFYRFHQLGERTESDGKNGLMRCHVEAANFPLHTDPIVSLHSVSKAGWTYKQYSFVMFWPFGAHSWCTSRRELWQALPHKNQRTRLTWLALLRTDLLFILGTTNVSTVITALWFPGNIRTLTTHH